MIPFISNVKARSENYWPRLRFVLPIGLSLFVSPLAVQFIYMIPLFEPKVSADAVLQFTGTVLGLAFAASIAYRKKRSELLAEREAKVQTKCVRLLHDLRVSPLETQLSPGTRERIMEISFELKAIDTSTSHLMHAAMKPLSQQLLDAQLAYYSEIENAKAEAFESDSVYSHEGEESEVFKHNNPERVFCDQKKQLMDKYLLDTNELQRLINETLGQLGKTF